MACVCETCAQHARTLGLEQTPRSRTAIHKAFRSAARLWHPDRYEREPGKRLEAEERFKQIQIAFRELTEHCDIPVEWLVEPAFSAPRTTANAPAISFGSAPGCFVASNFSALASQIAQRYIHENEGALAIVDLGGRAASQGTLAQFLLLTNQRILLRDARNIVSLLWYDDLGGLRLVDKRRRGRLGPWRRLVERLSGTEQKYVLEIERSDGNLFFTLGSQAGDSVKKVLYNFLQQKRPQPHH